MNANENSSDFLIIISQPPSRRQQQTMVSTSLLQQFFQSSNMETTSSFPELWTRNFLRQRRRGVSFTMRTPLTNKGRRNKVQRKKLFILVRILLQYLDKVDPATLDLAHEVRELFLYCGLISLSLFATLKTAVLTIFITYQVLKDCERKYKHNESKYETLDDAINDRLRDAVGETHWRHAHKIEKVLLVNHRKKKTLEFGLVGLGQQCTL